MCRHRLQDTSGKHTPLPAVKVPVVFTESNEGKRVTVTINRGSGALHAITGNVTGETTTHFHITRQSNQGNVAEWFAKQSPRVKCYLKK